MTDNKTARLVQNRRDDIATAAYSDEDTAAILDFFDAYNPDVFRLRPPMRPTKDQREDTLTDSTRLAYASTLHRTAQWCADDGGLVAATARDLNTIAQGRLRGTHPSVSGDGVSQNTVHQNQIAWRSWAQFHHAHPEGHGGVADPEQIILVDRDETAVDERDMFSPDEIRAMRDACRNPRDRAVLELLIYTGQRHNALRMLTVKDVRPDEGESGMLYLPDIEEGLKGARGKRPLLGAQKAVRDWLRQHPTGNPDDAFITYIYSWDGHDSIEQGQHISRNAFGRIPKRIADRAGVEKDANPHAFRHYFVTMAVSEHGMSFDTVRHLIGHSEGSRELERTYQHLVDADYIESAELDMGIRDEQEQSLTPSTCFVCSEPLDASDTYCPNCGERYGPVPEDAADELERRRSEGKLQARSEQAMADERTLDAILDENPDLKNQLLAALAEADDD